MAAPIEFIFDFISPNAYLAWPRVREIAQTHRRALIVTPVLFAALLEAHRQVGPAEIRTKRDWMMQNCLRKARSLGIPLRPPHSHPFNPLLVLRVALAVEDDDQRTRLTGALFDAVWAESRDPGDIDLVKAILVQSGLDAPAIIERAGSDEIKQRLRAETEMAVGQGVFGVPTMLVDGQLFFGFDDLPWLEQYLRGEDPVSRGDLEAWNNVQPSAWRGK